MVLSSIVRRKFRWRVFYSAQPKQRLILAPSTICHSRGSSMMSPHSCDPGVSDDEISVEGDKVGTITFANRTEHAVKAEEPGRRARCHDQCILQTDTHQRHGTTHRPHHIKMRAGERTIFGGEPCAFERDGVAEQIKV